MERKSLVRALVRRLMEKLDAPSAASLSAALAELGLGASDKAITSWLTDQGWQRMPDPETLSALLNIAGISEAGERLRYFDPTRATEAAGA